MCTNECKDKFGETNVLKIIMNKISFKPMNGSGGSMPCIVSLFFEVNGAFQHESFWNIAIFKNLIDLG